MEGLFLCVLRMSLTASYAILVILLLRLPLKKAPRSVSYALWSVAAFRLVCPVSFRSAFSLLPSDAGRQSANIVVRRAAQAAAAVLPAQGSGSGAASAASPVSVGAGIVPFLTEIGTALWLAGIAAMLAYQVVSLLLLRGRLKGARHTGRGIREAEGLRTPFVLGVFRPAIYLPAALPAVEREIVVRHERAHIRRLDHLVKPLAFVVLSIHWFNPLAWVAFSRMSADMELSCDERVLRELGGGVKKAYSSSLLAMAAGRSVPLAGPLAFGEGNIKSRIQNILRYRRPAFWVIFAAVLAAGGVGFGLLANPGAASGQGLPAQELYRLRTPYVGDASRVGGIFSRLPVPETLQHDGIRLFTKAQPYGVEVNFKAAAAEKQAFSIPGNQAVFNRSAVMLFALVQNASYVDFVVSDGSSPLTVRRTREWANTAMGEDVWNAASTQSAFSALYAKTMANYPDSYKAGK